MDGQDRQNEQDVTHRRFILPILSIPVLFTAPGSNWARVGEPAFFQFRTLPGRP
jgi:hypothetical protein